VLPLKGGRESKRRERERVPDEVREWIQERRIQKEEKREEREKETF